MPPPDLMAKLDALAERNSTHPRRRKPGPVPGTIYRARITRTGLLDSNGHPLYNTTAGKFSMMGTNGSSPTGCASMVGGGYALSQQPGGGVAQHNDALHGGNAAAQTHNFPPNPRSSQTQSSVRHACIVQNCSQRGQFFVFLDEFGGPGYRCLKHGRICCIKGCIKPGKRELPEDSMGPTGPRCMLHGGGVTCGVRGCEALAWRRKDTDKFGPGGLRCSRHGQPCNVDGCMKAGQRRQEADRHGPEGYRCNTHCSAPPEKRRRRGE